MQNSELKKSKMIWMISYVLLIYLTLPVMRPVLIFLKEYLGAKFDLATDAVLISTMAALAWLLIKNKIPWKKWILALVVFGIYGYGVKILSIPEERIHLLEYGFLSFLVFRAYDKVESAPSRYWQTFLTVSLIGTVDEIIQYFLPNRVGDVRDVLLNVASGILGLIIVYIFNKK